MLADARLGPRDPGTSNPSDWQGVLAGVPPGPTARGLLAGAVAFSVIVLAACWWLLSRAAGSGRVGLAAARVGWPVWSLPFALGPPLFSRDVYAYAAQGELARRGLDPSTVGASALGPGPFLAAVDPRWRETHAPYGSTAVLLQKALAALGGGDPGTIVVLFRLVALAAVAALVPLALLLVGEEARRAQALILLGMNPVVLIHLVSGAHLDAVAAALLVGALVADRRGAHAPAVVLACLAGTVKATAFLGLLWLLVDHARLGGLRRAARDTGVAAATAAVSALAVGLWPTWLRTLDTPGHLRTEVAPSSLLARLVSGGLRLAGLSGADAAVLAATRLAGLALAAAVVLGLLAHTRAPRDLRVVGYGSLAVAVLGPVLYPWYLALAVPPLAALDDRARRTVVALSVTLCLATLPSLTPTWRLFGPVGPWVLAGAAATAALCAVLRSAPARRARRP